MSFTIDLVCRRCKAVLVASFGEVLEGERQATFTMASVECEHHPGAGNRLLITVRPGGVLPCHHGPERLLGDSP